MAVKVEVNYKNSYLSGRDLKSTYAYFADLEKSIPTNFPGLERFDKLGPQNYHWVFQKVSHSGQEFQIQVVTQFRLTPEKSIEMTSVPHPNASTLKGGWTFTPTPDGKTKVEFAVSLQSELPIPFFLKGIAGPLAQKEISKIFDRYLQNVEQALS